MELNPKLLEALQRSSSDLQYSLLFLFGAGILNMQGDDLLALYELCEEHVEWNVISKYIDNKNKLKIKLIISESTGHVDVDTDYSSFSDEINSKVFWESFKERFYRYKNNAPQMYRYTGNTSKKLTLKKIMDCYKESGNSITSDQVLKAVSAYVEDAYRNKTYIRAAQNWVWSSKEDSKTRAYYLLDWIEKLDEVSDDKPDDYTKLI